LLILVTYCARRSLHSFPTRRSSDLENANAFAHLVDTHEIAVINIAVVANSDVEIEFWIDAIRIGAAHIVGHTAGPQQRPGATVGDRKSTRLNSSHVKISYAVFCLKK